MTPITQRHTSIDAVRGFAVLGILLMNIVGMGMPSFAYVDPTFYGGHEGANLGTWALNYVFADGKMRGLFTILFGASLLLITDRAEGRTPGPAATHYRRMVWLLVFGMAHAYLLFFGDILVTYALAGCIAFLFRKLGGRLLVAIGVGVLLALLAKGLVETAHLRALQAAAETPGAATAAIEAWREASFILRPPAEMIEAELKGFGGGFMDALQARSQMTMIMQLAIMPTEFIPEAVGQMLVGMGLFKLGFFTLGWSSKAYRRLLAVGLLVAAPVTAVLAWLTVQVGFDPLQSHYYVVLGAAPRPFMALAYAAAILLLVRSGLLGGIVDRFAAAGRMAFSNYLMTSIITTLVFCGFGLGLYGQLERFELYYVVAGVWAFILLWSKPWLATFHYGPFEWLWRSLVLWTPQPFLRRRTVAPSAV